ncbi:MAG: PIN domain-containing protein [Gaiellales bacterium]
MIDTSAFLQFFDGDAEQHATISALIEAERDPLVVSPFVLAELDYLITRRFSAHHARRAMQELVGGAYHLVDVGWDDVQRTLRLIDRHADRRLGLTDASLLEIADRLHITTVFTLDRRDFDGLVRSDGTPLTILP